MPATAVETEIASLEARLRDAELGPDQAFFQQYLDDSAVLVTEGKASMAKTQVVAAHNPATGPKFTRVEMTEMQITDHGNAAVVTCNGMYEGSTGTHNLKFMRVWVKKSEGWRIVAGTVS